VISLLGIHIFEPQVHTDHRGHFFESFSERSFEEETGIEARFVQDNQSRSRLGVIRGLHYQLPPVAQGKLVRVVQGAVWDVVVDIRRASETFGDWFGIELSAANRRQLWIPPGFAHGFLATADQTDLLYKVTAPYSAEWERSVRWDDPAIGINWPTVSTDRIISDRDANAPLLRHADIFES